MRRPAHQYDFPAAAVEGCEFCAKRGGAFTRLCRGCMVRWISRQPRQRRIGIYEELLAQLGKEGLDVLKKEVAAAWEQEREEARSRSLQEQAARDAEHAARMQAARGAMKR